MIVAITGGTGFIGKLLVEKHLTNGDQVRVLTRKIKSKKNGVKYFIGDLSSHNINFSNFLDGAHILYHCAGEVNDLVLMQELHVNGTKRLVKAARGKISRWVQLSSVGAYGKYNTGIISENSSEDPNGIYEKTKTESDHIVINSGIPYTILRPSIVFANEMPNQSLKDLLYLVQKGLFFFIGEKNKYCVNYVHIEDVVKLLMILSTNKKALGQIFNLSQSISIERMIKAFRLGNTSKKKILRLPESIVRIIVKILFWIPKFPLTTSRVDALTNECVYVSTKAQKRLGFNFAMTLEERFELFAKKK